MQRGLIPAAALGHAQPGSHLQLGPHAEHMAEDASPQLFGSSRPPLSPQVGTGKFNTPKVQTRAPAIFSAIFIILIPAKSMYDFRAVSRRE